MVVWVLLHQHLRMGLYWLVDSLGLEVKSKTNQPERGLGLGLGLGLGRVRVRVRIGVGLGLGRVRKLSVGRIFVFPSTLQPNQLGETGRPKISQGQDLCPSQSLVFLLCCFRPAFLGTSLSRETVIDKITSKPSVSVTMSLALRANWEAHCSLLPPPSSRRSCSFPNPKGCTALRGLCACPPGHS